MYRTAEGIEEAKEQNSLSAESDTVTTRNGKRVHRRSLANLKPYPKGVSGNPAGRPKNDTGALIARAILEENPEAIYKALGGALLKGNAYVFKELCDRAYGKAKESVDLTVNIEQDVAQRLKQARVRLAKLRGEKAEGEK